MLLTSCQSSIFSGKENPPADLIAQITADNKNQKDFKVVDSYKFKLNDADVRNNATSRWCVAYTYSYYQDFSQKWLLAGQATGFTEINGIWDTFDDVLFSPFAAITAEKTSCAVLSNRY